MTDVDPTLNPFGPMVVPRGVSTVAVTIIKGRPTMGLSRDELFIERLSHVAVAAGKLTAQLAALVELQPHSAAEQEQRLRFIEGELADAMSWATRIAEFAGKGEKT